MLEYEVKPTRETCPILCNWCDKKALVKITDKSINWSDYACNNHFWKFFNDLAKNYICPDCNSTNIEVTEGALLHYVANHSGQCLDCDCIWKID